MTNPIVQCNNRLSVESIEPRQASAPPACLPAPAVLSAVSGLPDGRRRWSAKDATGARLREAEVEAQELAHGWYGNGERASLNEECSSWPAKPAQQQPRAMRCARAHARTRKTHRESKIRQAAEASPLHHRY